MEHRAVITGGAGFIGSYVAELAEGCPPVFEDGGQKRDLAGVHDVARPVARAELAARGSFA
jgi:nucleoside-diphosphate-sugar epimerase